ncbi:putative LRR receptor-like serine/threonine-protein kinase [Nymphaea thermarum]|nr:putative LRR receptor-like serine/threonine-protein kinase [Nymphaea thermarum]
MIDVACALEYLLHGYSMTIVHCDLNPSNVLLDESMTVYIGDFGIAKILVRQNSSALTATLGATRYIVPEVFTGRKNLQMNSFGGDFCLRQWVAEEIQVAISDVIDSHHLNESNNTTTERSTARNEVPVMIMEIGLSCSMESATERMDMKEVVARLKRIRHNVGEHVLKGPMVVTLLPVPFQHAPLHVTLIQGGSSFSIYTT